MRSEGYSTWFVRASVCLCVDAYSGTTGYEAAYELYKRVQIYEGLNIKKAILLKRLRWGDISLVNQPVFLRMRAGEKNGLARFLKSAKECVRAHK